MKIALGLILATLAGVLASGYPYDYEMAEERAHQRAEENSVHVAEDALETAIARALNHLDQSRDDGSETQIRIADPHVREYIA